MTQRGAVDSGQASRGGAATPVKDFILERLVPYDVSDPEIAAKGYTSGEMNSALVNARLLRHSHGGYRNAFAGAMLAKMSRRGEVEMHYRRRGRREMERLFYLAETPTPTTASDPS